MLKVQFDDQIFSMQRYGGISRYFANIQHYLKKQPDVSVNNGLLYSKNYYTKDEGYLTPFLADVFVKKEKSLKKWNRKYSSYLITRNDYDVFHPTYYNPYFLKNLRKPFVLTVHDMIHELYPEFFEPGDDFVKYKRLCIEKAAHIIAISHSTKEDLKNILGIEDSRISVIHHGYSPLLSSSSDSTLPQQKHNYLLFVGDRKGYKNFPRFVTAIAGWLLKNPSFNLICAGGGAFQSAEQELLKRLKIQDQVQQTSASDIELSILYKNALAFIYPSLYEGFGLPILEAFQNNCPVIASNNNCFKEIGENAIAYFDPLDETQMLKSIENIVTNSAAADKLTKHGQQQLLKFPLDLCMEKTLKVYKSIV